MRGPLLCLSLLLGAAPAADAQDRGWPVPPGAGRSAQEDTPARTAALEGLKKDLASRNKLDVMRAIESIGRLATPAARVVLEEFVRKTASAEYASYAALGLGWKGNGASLDFLCGKEGVKSSRLLVAEAACEALGWIEDKRAVPTLLEAVKQDKSVIAAAAIEAVAKLDPAAPGLADHVVSLADSKDTRLRSAVARALGSLESPKAAPCLVAMAQKDGNSLVRREACFSLRRFDDGKVRAALEEIAKKDSSQEVRDAAAEVLKGMKARPPKPPEPAPPAEPRK